MSKTWIQLGRTGDVLNILPLLWSDAQKGERPRLMVARDYAGILDGLSYVEPFIYEGPPYEIHKAVALVEGAPWVCTQVNGPKKDVAAFVYGPAKMENARTTSFQKEQWRVAGRLQDWDQCLPLIFDKRDPKREEALLDSVLKKKAKFILVAADGYSSPFPYKDLLLELVAHCGYAVVNLADVKAERFYDLLALYERAYCLVSIDTAPLHLAWACRSLPVFAIVNDRPLAWNGSSWRPTYEWYCRYHDFPDRCTEMLKGIRGLQRSSWRFLGQEIVHIWNADGASYHPQYAEGFWRPIPIRSDLCTRRGPENDPQAPFLRDCVRVGMQRAGDLGWVCLTRPGVQFEEFAADKLMLQSPCFAYRMNRKDGRLEHAPVVDLFCAKPPFWREVLQELPDLLLSKDYYWAHALWAVFHKHGATDLTGIVYREATKDANKPSDPSELSSAAGFNSTLATNVITTHKVTSRYPKVTDQLPCEPLDLNGLKPFGYNPSLVEDEGFVIMAYRFHPSPTEGTKIALAQIDPTGEVLSNRLQDLNCKSAEDPSFFRAAGRIYMGFVASSLPHLPVTAVVRYTEVYHGKAESILTPNLPGNNNRSVQKNWVFWDANPGLYCLYCCEPKHQVFRLEGIEPSQPLETDPPRWAWGEIRGGTPPVRYETALLRFFHSSLDNEWGQYRRRYYMGAYLMEPEPPFKVLRVSSRPILYGSEIDNIKVKDRPTHWKANVVFPGGVLVGKDSWLVSVGVNDSACALVRVTPKDLNL